MNCPPASEIKSVPVLRTFKARWAIESCCSWLASGSPVSDSASGWPSRPWWLWREPDDLVLHRQQVAVAAPQPVAVDRRGLAGLDSGDIGDDTGAPE